MIVAGPEVVQWVAERTGDDFGSKVAGIAELRAGTIVAGCVFEDYNGRNVTGAIAIDAPPGRRFWWAIFDYAFNRLGVERITAHVEESNSKSVRLLKKMGFEQEAVLEGAGSDGSDYLIFVMWKYACKQLKWGKRNG